MNKLFTSKRIRVVAALVEGAGINSVSRMTLPNLTCKRIQFGEIWSFCFAKDRNLPDELKDQFGYGSVWIWMGIDADTKLIPSWLVGGRDASYAEKFISDLGSK